MQKPQSPPETVARLEAELRALRLELAGAELAFSMVGRALSSAAPEVARGLIAAMEAAQSAYDATPAVQGLLDGLRNTRPAPPVRPRRQPLRVVVDNG